jgi:hypothetical protein
MKRAMILLVGEQPVPNLLPARRVKPDTAVLVYTERTRRVAENLKELLETNCNCLLCKVHPYHISEILDEVRKFLSNNLADHAFTFNLTGGTKPMALAAFSLARMYNSPFVYFQTEGNRSRLYHYVLAADEIHLERVEELPDTITLDDYLRVYLGSYETGEPRNDLERQVKQALCSVPDLEVLWSLRPQGLEALEVDFVVRLGNQVGVGEVKTKGAKSGIDQITAVAEQRYLGTYVRKFLISGKPVDRNNRNLAQAYTIEVIELPSYSTAGALSPEDRQKLTRSVLTRLGGAS